MKYCFLFKHTGPRNAKAEKLKFTQEYPQVIFLISAVDRNSWDKYVN